MTERFEIRDAIPSDYAAFLRLFPALEIPDPVPERAEWEHDFMPRSIFLDAEGVSIAYAASTVLGTNGYVINVVVDPAHQRRGAGRALMDALAERFRARGCTGWMLNVKVDNLPARRLYASVGMREDYSSFAMRLDWANVARLPEADREVAARPLDPAEDAAMERAFGLPERRLTVQRERLNRLFFRLVDTAAPDEPRVGVAVFAPKFPGVFPFRVARPALARPFLEAIRAHALPEHDFIRLTIEDAPDLVRVLDGAGAETVLELVQMSGPLA